MRAARQAAIASWSKKIAHLGERYASWRLARDKRYQAACVTNLAQGWTSFGVRSTLVPVLVVEVLDRPTSWTGIAFAVAAVAQTLALAPTGRAACRPPLA